MSATVTVAPVIAFYPTPAGGRVELTDQGPETTWRYRSRCTGCPHEDGYRTIEAARRHAAAHAEACFETTVPQPQVSLIEFARSLEAVSPQAPMTDLAVRIGLAAVLGRAVIEQEVDELPTIAAGMTRAEYARLLRQA